MNFRTLTAFTLTLTENEVDALLKELEEVNEKYWSASLEDFYNELGFQAEFFVQYNRKSAIALREAIRAIPYNEQGATMNNLDYAISLTLN